MIDVALAKMLVEHYGWPIVAVVVALVFTSLFARFAWRMMSKHEGQMGELTHQLTVLTDVNRNIVTGLQAVADKLGQHDRAEEERHRDTRSHLRFGR